MFNNFWSAYEVSKKALTSDAKYILAFSTQGRLINALSRFRPNTIILGLVADEKLVNKYGAHYGVYAQHQADQSAFNDDAKVMEIAKAAGIKAGEKIIVANSKEFRTLRIS